MTSAIGTTLLEAALAYGSAGLCVFPLRPRAKEPFEGIGVYQATGDESQIRTWWTERPDANIGVAFGNGFVGVDVDPRNGGTATLDALVAERGDAWTRTAGAITGRGDGGRHLYFRTDAPVGCGKLGPGIDVKGVGGYLVGAGSVHPDTGKVYEAIAGEVLPAPAWLLERLKSGTSYGAHREDLGYDDASLWRALTPREIATIRGAIAKLPPAIDGSNGSGKAIAAACECIRQIFTLHGWMERPPRHDVALRIRADWRACVETWNVSCQPPWSEGELAHKFDDALIKVYGDCRDLEDGRALLPPTGAKGAKSANVVLTSAAEIEEERLEWLWPGYVPKGKCTIVQGDGGLGKSLMILDLAARISSGRSMPLETGSQEPGNVLILTMEDDKGDTIKPRLRAAGADLTRIFFLHVALGEDGTRDLSFPSDVSRLREAIEQTDARLVVIDPLADYVDAGKEGVGINLHKDQDVRRAVSPLTRLAQETGTTFIIVNHLNKDTSKSAQHRGSGSAGIRNSVRSVLLVGKDPESPEVQRAVVPDKRNLAPGDLSALRWKIVTTSLEVKGFPMHVARIEWVGRCKLTSDDVLGTKTSDDAPALEKAKTFLLEELDDGRQMIKTLRKRAKDLEIAPRTLERAAKELQVSSKSYPSDEGTKEWFWFLPGKREPSKFIGGEPRGASENA